MSTEGNMEIFPGIWQFKLPIPAATQSELGEMVGETNVYLIQGNDGWLLVDAGWDDPANIVILQQGLIQVGISVGDISQIVATHFHLDHFGLAGKLRQLSGARLALHREEAPFIELIGGKFAQTLEQSRDWLLRNGTPKKEIPDDSGFYMDLDYPDDLLSGGERISTGFFDFEVLWTPGHSPGHICLYERSRKLFISGDHMLEDITPEIGTSPLQYPNPLADYLNCLENLKELEVELVLPAHGSLFSHFRRRTDELIEHHQNRKDQILAVLEKGPLTAFDIASKIAWIPQKGGVPWEKLDVMNRRLALLETWAHLRLLEDERKTTTFVKGDLIFYCTNSHLKQQ